jgi:hypothetical protein
MLRSILAVVSGIIVAFSVITIAGLVGHALWPAGDNVDFADRESVRAFIAKMPVAALVFVAVSDGVGTFVGAVAVAAIARRRKVTLAMTLGALVMAAGVGNLVLIPHPAWFWVADLAVYLPAAYAGARLASPRVSQQPELSGPRG